VDSIIDLVGVTSSVPRLVRQRPKGAGVPRREPAPLPLGPSLELRRLAQKEAVQERTPIQRMRPRRVAAGEPVLEFSDVSPDLRMEVQRVGARYGRCRQLPAQRIDVLLEGVAGILAGALGPQIGDQPVTRRLAGRRPLGLEQRQPPSLTAPCRRGRR